MTFEPDPKLCTVGASRDILRDFILAGVLATTVNEKSLYRFPKHGERAVVRRRRKARRKAHSLRLQRVSWCSYFEGLK